MKKKIILFASLLLVPLFTSCNKKENYELITKDNINYILYNGENKVALVVGYNDELGTEISLPSEVNGYKVNAIAHNAFASSSLVKITIPESIVYIGKRAFAESTNLKEVVLPNTISALLTNTFAECSSLTTINLPTSLEYISTGAFLGCRSLSNLNFPESLVSLGEYSFASCTSINNLDFSNTSLTAIGSNCFYNCSSLSNINFNNDLTSISDYAFSSCTSLEKIYIPESITYLGKDLFSDCNKNFKILFEGSELPVLYSYSFTSGYPFALGVKKDSKITDAFKIENNIQYSINNFDTNTPTAFVHYIDDYDKRPSTIKLENSISSGGKTVDITEIMPTAFSLNEKLTDVDLSLVSKLAYIGNNAFYYDYNLNSITLPSKETSTYIGIGAFYKCRKLKDIKNLNIIKDLNLNGYTFAECYNLGNDEKYPFILSKNIKSITSTDFLEWGTINKQYIEIEKDTYTKLENDNVILDVVGDNGSSIYLEKISEGIYYNNKYFGDSIITLGK